MRGHTERPRTSAFKTGDWLSWFIGAAVLVAVVAAALHLSEAKAFVRLAEEAELCWLALALILQAATYFAEGEIWRAIGRAAGRALGVASAFVFSLAKLFVDQAIPSAGLSGTLVVARGLARQHVPQAAITGGVVARLVSYYAAYVVSLGAAVVIAVFHGQANALIELVCVAFVVFAVLFCIGVLALSGRPGGEWRRRSTRYTHLREGLQLLESADPKIARSPRLILQSTALQLCIVALDAATMWALIRAMGSDAAPASVFASFMISTLFRSLGILPGGLGSFEAVSVVTLKMVAVPIPVALSATLLFRALTFWLPMLPGMWCSRRVARHVSASPAEQITGIYWSQRIDALLAAMHSGREGLTAREAARRLRLYGRNELKAHKPLSAIGIMAEQVRSPLLLILIFAAVVSAITAEWTDAVIVLVIVVATVGIGYVREYGAAAAAAALRARIRTHTSVMRDGVAHRVPLEKIVPGDVVTLSAGSLVPGDAVILEASDCFVSEAMLTGESFPVRKEAGEVAADTPLSRRRNCLYLGTNVRSGTARCLVVATGTATEFGQIAHRLALRPPETEFDRGLLRFGYLLTSAMLVMVLLVFVAHVLQGRPPIETLLFAIALAVGLSPELLPAILRVNLSRGAQMMAHQGVLVRHLNAIENLGSMDVLCTDKTGTLTEGVVKLEGACDPAGNASPAVLELGATNAALSSGLSNPLDDAILEARKPDLAVIRKLDEIPFDFVRKRVSVVVQSGGHALLVAKGAFRQVLDACTHVAGGAPIDAAMHKTLEELHGTWAASGIRALAVATRELPRQTDYTKDDEQALCLAGFLTFLDRPKAGAHEAIAELGRLGVSVKLITGDTKAVALHVAGLVGLSTERVLTGRDLDELHDEALWREAERTDLFVEVDPNQKERIILSLRKMGHVVGFLGDGVNDAPAMHSADTSLSVDQAVDVAREAADFVLLQRNLEVIRRGIEEGRRTFANTLKYVLTTTSANLGNMVSMAAASLLLPFLPLLAGQILLNNLLSDIPAMGIAEDSVDPELVERPRRWDMKFIGRFMVEFGALSSLFDFITFGALLTVFHATVEEFRTGWFVESLLTELVIALVVRTRRPFFRSRPGTVLLVSTGVLIALAFAIPYLPYANLLGFVPLPMGVILALAAITVLYVAATEVTKRWFYRRAF
jgi:Mg2+-importing ATPase